MAPFEITFKQPDPPTHQALLLGLYDLVKSRGWIELAENVKRYTINRADYLQVYGGQYVNITADEIRFTEKKDDYHGFGMFMKVGEEGDKTPARAFFAVAQKDDRSAYATKITFAAPQAPMLTKDGAVFDTGASVTIFSIEYLDWLESEKIPIDLSSGHLWVVGDCIQVFTAPMTFHIVWSFR